MPRQLIKKTAQKTTKLGRKSIQTTVQFGMQFRHHIATAVIAAFSFLIALSWKDFIVNAVQNATKIEAFNRYPYLEDLLTAIIITILAMIGIALISKWAVDKKDESSG